MTDEEANYVFRYFGASMTQEEALAWKHYSLSTKLEHSQNEESVEARRAIYFRKGWLTKDDEVLKLLDSGIDEFIRKVAQRILEEDSENVEFNRCPNCKRLARTPAAKQCRHCGYDWH